MADSISIGAAYRDQAIVNGSITTTPVGATTLTSTGATNLANTSACTLGFHGATAVVQRQSSAFAAVATTAAINSSISSSCFGFTSAQATAIILLVNELRAAAVELGLIAT